MFALFSGTDGADQSLSLGIGSASANYNAWSRSFIEMYTITHEWIIENFIELDDEATVIFKVNCI